MATNVELDPKLIAQAQKLGKHRSKRATIEEALREYVQRRKQRGIMKLFGTIDFDPTYDYKAERRRR